MNETTWRVEWYGPDADGHKRFASHRYTDRDRMRADVADLLLRPEITSVHVVDLIAHQCPDCGGIMPNCECSDH